MTNRKIEITPEMIEAGVDKLIDGTSMFSVWRLSESERVELVSHIFQGMASRSLAKTAMVLAEHEKDELEHE